MKTKKNIQFTGIVLSLLIQMTGCSPVNRFTRIEKIPGQYITNYCNGNVKPRHALIKGQKDPWIVFSDREENQTYKKPGGKIVMKNMEFMTPLMVIGHKGDYLRLAKYTPDNVENKKIKDRKKTGYYGWIHQSKVLLTREASTDIRSGLKNKYLTIFADTTLLSKAPKFIERDSLYTFRDTDLSVKNTKIPLYSIVYRMKQSGDGKSSLLSTVPFLPADSTAGNMSGWVDNSLLKNIGQQLHIVDRTPPETENPFSSRYPALRYAPVIARKEDDAGTTFSTLTPLPVIDKQNNFVLNVNGNPVFYPQFINLTGQLRKINIVFVMEGAELSISKIPGLANVIQTLQSGFQQPDDPFSYRFGLVLPFKGEDNTNYQVTGLQKDYTELTDFLADKITNITQLKTGPKGNWPGIRQAIKLFKGHETETNLIVLIGETGNGSKWETSALAEQLAGCNCRVLGFQLYGGESDSHNNFVLQIESIIDQAAARIATNKREMIVYANQLHQSNQYTEHGKNAYGLDFPAKSMTQGWIVFPPKSRSLAFEGLETAIDTLLQEIRLDNNTLITSLQKAFEQAGNHRDKFDTAFISHFRLETSRAPAKEFLASFAGESPCWYSSSPPVTTTKTGNNDISYQLLLSKEELKGLRIFLAELSQYEVDYKSNTGKKEKTARVCDCPPEEPPAEPSGIPAAAPPQYAPTGKIRRHLVRFYLHKIKENKHCIPRKKTVGSYSLARVHQEITACPSRNELMDTFTIKDLKKQTSVTDEILDTLLIHFKDKKTILEKTVCNLPRFISNGTEYYWLSADYLP